MIDPFVIRPPACYKITRNSKFRLIACLRIMRPIHLKNEEQVEAIQAWVTVYTLANKMNLAQILAALENLADQLGLPGGMAGWETLTERFASAK